MRFLTVSALLPVSHTQQKIEQLRQKANFHEARANHYQAQYEKHMKLQRQAEAAYLALEDGEVR